MDKNSYESIRRKYNRKLIFKGFNDEFIKNLKSIFSSKDKELNFIKFLIKHAFMFVCGLIPIIVNFIKTGRFELDSCIVSLLVILLLLFVSWLASRICL